MLLLLLQGSALVPRAEAGRDRLHAESTQPWTHCGNAGRTWGGFVHKAVSQETGRPGGGAYISRQTPALARNAAPVPDCACRAATSSGAGTDRSPRLADRSRTQVRTYGHDGLI
jgi:hypothetical protein